MTSQPGEQPVSPSTPTSTPTTTPTSTPTTTPTSPPTSTPTRASTAIPTGTTRWRCALCGNLTRFDVVRSSRVREYLHLDLTGEPRVEETEILRDTLEQIRCRWCNAVDSVELVPRPELDGPAS